MRFLIPGLLVLAAIVVEPAVAEEKPDAPLSNTYWKLLTVGGKAAEFSEGRREAHMILRLDGKVAGSTGCNRMSGTYETKGEALTFGPIAATRMFCKGTAETERLFMAALAKTNGWRTKGDTLAILDGGGAVLATFAAVYLP
jgi:heat shock protein HslJ